MAEDPKHWTPKGGELTVRSHLVGIDELRGDNDPPLRRSHPRLSAIVASGVLQTELIPAEVEAELKEIGSELLEEELAYHGVSREEYERAYWEANPDRRPQ